jgi:PAS domain S-box-containing protein
MNRKPPGEAVSNNQAANSLTWLTCPLAQVGAIILFGSKSLKTRITVITFAIVLLGSWSLALLVSRLLERDMVQLLSNQQFSLATLLAKEIDQELAMRLDMLERVAIAAELPMQQGPAAIQAYVEARPVLHHLFNGGLVVYDREGLALASVPLGKGRVGTYLRDAELIARAIDRGHVTVGRAFLGERLDTPAFAMAAPIRDEHGGVVGIIVGEIELGLRNFMTETMSTPYGRTGGYLLIDRTAGKSSRRPTAGASWRNCRHRVHPVIDHFLDGHEGTAILINRLGQEVLVANKGIRSADWIISVVAPTEEVFAPIAAMQQRLLGMTLILTLIGAALTWWFIRRQFVPLEQGLHSLAVMRQPGQPLTPLPVSREDEIGQLVGAFNALIAEVEVRETALRESDDCLRSILATSLDGFWRVSEEGRLLEVNETYARMSGYTVDELVGMHVSQLVADESPSVAAERHAKILATGHLQFEDVHRRKDGSVWHMESSATYRAGGGGQVVAFIRDISARKRDEARCARRSANSRPWCSNLWSVCTSSVTATGCTSTRRWRACSATPVPEVIASAKSATWSPRKAGSWLPKPAAPAERRDRSTQLWLHRLAQGWHASPSRCLAVRSNTMGGRPCLVCCWMSPNGGRPRQSWSATVCSWRIWCSSVPAIWPRRATGRKRQPRQERLPGQHEP